VKASQVRGAGEEFISKYLEEYRIRRKNRMVYERRVLLDL